MLRGGVRKRTLLVNLGNQQLSRNEPSLSEHSELRTLEIKSSNPISSEPISEPIFVDIGNGLSNLGSTRYMNASLQHKIHMKTTSVNIFMFVELFIWIPNQQRSQSSVSLPRPGSLNLGNLQLFPSEPSLVNQKSYF